MTTHLSTDELERLEELFDRASALPREQHAAFVARECAADDPLRAELVRMLGGHLAADVLVPLRPGAPLPPGTRIGRYELRERVGEGGMGEVYAAEQLEPVERRVAVKLIRPGMDSAQLVVRFEAERQALARMAHPNVAQVFDGGTADDGRPYFVMEFVEGEPLTEYADRHRLSTNERLQLFLDVCDGVQHAHQKGLIHRDLKPSNLLVTQHDGRAVPKIIDFGVARATTGRLVEQTLATMVGQIVGTLDYMSPEQADPSGTGLDTRSDVYSLGVVLYQLLSGLLPFDHESAAGRSLSEILRTLHEQDPPTPSTRLRRQTGTSATIAARHGADVHGLVRQLAGDLDWICLKALEKDPERRYATVSELAQDVRRHLADVPVLAGRPGGLYRARKFVRRHRFGVTAGALVAASVIAGVVGIVTARNEAQDNATRAENALVELTQVSAPGLLEMLKREADEQLWPPKLDDVPAYDAWLADASALVADLDPAADGSYPGHRRQLEALRARALPRTEQERQADRDAALDERRSFTFAKVEDARAHQPLAALIEELEELSDPETGLIAGTGIDPEHGWGVQRRRDYAATLAERTLTCSDARERWSAATASIAEHSSYDGLLLAPQLGLLPLGSDPRSGLWEFAHVMSGEPAERDPATGELAVSNETGLVLVLLPGGAFTMGAQSDDPGGPNYDPEAIPEEGPPHVASVEPFFLSKFEMTRAQWLRFAGTSLGFTDPRWGLRPVWGPSQVQSMMITRRLGLGLPTEEQWEYAARAGTSTIWWTGDELASLEGAENLYDRSQGKHARFQRGEDPVDWKDDHKGPMDVGSFRANPFGLHDVHGNVSEWCSGPYYNYSKAPEPPFRAQFKTRVARGGNYRSARVTSRSTWRGFNAHEAFMDPTTGLRPSRAIDP